MSDIDTIKDRVRKLMAVAGDGVASEAEIETAMRLAANLLDKHHLDMSDCEAEGGAEDKSLEMGDAWATSNGTKFSTWESVLSHAVADLFGTVKHYLSYQTQPIRVNGIVTPTDDGKDFKRGRKVCFYGPAEEAREAADLFTEWARSIATMGVARWGGCFRGDGAMYCYGFAKAIRNKVEQVREERSLIPARPLPTLTGGKTTAITLLRRHDLLKERAEKWIKEEKGVNLGKSSRGSGYSAGSSDAYNEGRRHGESASFGRNAKRRQLPG